MGGTEGAQKDQDPFDLARFTAAQEGVYAAALSELRSGRKRTHWMWFIFPQVAGLGHSPLAQRYALHSLAEARAYLAHPVLGARLRACAGAVLAVEGRTASEIFGDPDARKLRSSVTLFAQASGPDSVFAQASGPDSVFAQASGPDSVFAQASGPDSVFAQASGPDSVFAQASGPDSVFAQASGPDSVFAQASGPDSVFAQASGPDSVFARVLDKYYAGDPDPETRRRLQDAPP